VALVPSLSAEQLWTRPGGAASVGFHIMHLAGSLDRLLTYARGESLNEQQRADLAAEEDEGRRESPAALLGGAEKAIDPAGMYTVICIDYLLNVTGGDYAAVLKQAKNIRPLGITIRAAITDYVKAETAAGREIKSSLDGRYVFDRAASGGAEEPRQ